jgi:hypothetical protein
MSPEVREAIESVQYIAENMRLQNEAQEVSASLLDRSRGTGGEVLPYMTCHSLQSGVYYKCDGTFFR